MEVSQIDEMAAKLSELYDRIDEINITLKPLENEAEEIEQQLAKSLVSEGKPSWVIPGRKPFKLSVKTYWNIEDLSVLVPKLTPEMVTSGRLAQSINSWANAEAATGVDMSKYGITPYEKVTVNGGQKIS